MRRPGPGRQEPLPFLRSRFAESPFKVRACLHLLSAAVVHPEWRVAEEPFSMDYGHELGASMISRIRARKSASLAFSAP
jgi:hypothetical protein